jgi:hypothetical protein
MILKNLNEARKDKKNTVSQSAEALGIKPRGYYQLESYQFIGSVPI